MRFKLLLPALIFVFAACKNKIFIARKYTRGVYTAHRWHPGGLKSRPPETALAAMAQTFTPALVYQPASGHAPPAENVWPEALPAAGLKKGALKLPSAKIFLPALKNGRHAAAPKKEDIPQKEFRGFAFTAFGLGGGSFLLYVFALYGYLVSPTVYGVFLALGFAAAVAGIIIAITTIDFKKYYVISNILSILFLLVSVAALAAGVLLLMSMAGLVV